MMLEPKQKQVLREYAKIAVSYVAPIYWVSLQDGGEHKINNGTIFFLDCGQGVFAVTAYHVYRGYLDSKENGTVVSCQILNLPFDPWKRFIGGDGDSLDIVTFKISEDEIKSIGDDKRVVRVNGSEWPPNSPVIGQGTFFAGYPGNVREMKGPRDIEFGVSSVIDTIESVSDRSVSCVLDQKDNVDILNGGQDLDNYNWAGFSGAPMFGPGDGNIKSWRLCGVVRSFSDDYRMFKATRVDYILPDGRIRESIV